MLDTRIVWLLEIFTRVIQWTSAVIVLGIISYFIHSGPSGEHLIYQEVIAAISIAFFFPAFISPFMPVSLDKFVLVIDVVFSYLWLTSFIFATQDYNWHRCFLNSPPDMGCGRKKANESFIFIACIFTFFGIFSEVADLWVIGRRLQRKWRECMEVRLMRKDCRMRPRWCYGGCLALSIEIVE